MIKTSLFFLAVLTLSGCVASVSPLCNDEEGMALDGLPGRWRLKSNGPLRAETEKEAGILTIRRTRSGYALSSSTAGVTREYAVKVIRLGNAIYADAVNSRLGDSIDTIPVHHIARLSLHDDTLTVALCDARRLQDALAAMSPERRLRTTSTFYRTKVVITSSTDELQLFFGGGRRVFGDERQFVREQPSHDLHRKDNTSRNLLRVRGK